MSADTDDHDRHETGPARYRAYTLGSSLAARRAAVSADTCARKRCPTTPTVAIDTLDHRAGAYCTPCAERCLNTDPTAREYPLDAVALPDGGIETQIQRLPSSLSPGDGAAHELTPVTRGPGTRGEWLVIESQTDDPGYATGVVNLADNR